MHMLQIKTILGIFTLFVFVITFISGCAEKPSIPNQIPLQFDIYYSFGVFEKNILDTKNNLYIKDMVVDQPQKYDFKLTLSEKEEIYDVIVANDLFTIKNDFIKNCNNSGLCLEKSPSRHATLKIITKDTIKTITFFDNYFYQDDPELKRFQNVLDTIQKIISQKEVEIGIEQPKS
jgi:hypothetical protein